MTLNRREFGRGDGGLARVERFGSSVNHRLAWRDLYPEGVASGVAIRAALFSGLGGR